MSQILPIDPNGAGELEELFDLHMSEIRMTLEDFCSNGKPRCQNINNDSDSISFSKQCNLRKNHDNICRFGMDSMLAESFPDGTKFCTDDNHEEENCSVCWVREIRDGC